MIQHDVTVNRDGTITFNDRIWAIRKLTWRLPRKGQRVQVHEAEISAGRPCLWVHDPADDRMAWMAEPRAEESRS